MNSREIILDMLLEMKDGTYSSKLIKDVLDKYDYLDGREKGFIKRVCEGTIEREIELDYILNQFSNTPVKKMKPLIRELLRMSTYQIMFMDQVPDSAVCNEAVKLAGKRKFQNLKGFVNGVLRSISRQKDSIKYPDRSNLEEYLHIKYSMPLWLVQKFIQDYGIKTAEIICQALLETKPVSIRMKESLAEEEIEAVLLHFSEKQIPVQKLPYLPYAYALEKTENISNLEDFQKGLFTVQDISSMLIGECAGVKQGDYIIDVCAAPGGKTMHVAEKLKKSGFVDARDLTERKVQLILENKERMGYTNVQAKEWDGTILDEEAVQKADIVLADVPCSGLGVIGKKRDIKYRITAEEIAAIVELQKQIVTNAWQYVKQGGTFLYSTCTISKEENEEMVEWMCTQFPLELQSLDEVLPEGLQCETTKKGFLQLLPGVHGSDGFFLAKMKRVDA